MKDAAEKSVSDEAFAKRSERWADDAGCSTKEAYFYRDIFECELAQLVVVLSPDTRLTLASVARV